MKSEDWRGTVWTAGQRMDSGNRRKKQEIGGLEGDCLDRGSTGGFWESQEKTGNRKNYKMKSED